MKFLIQEGHSVIPKSVHEERIVSNGELFDFMIQQEDLEALRKMNKNIRTAKMDFFYKPMGIDYDTFWKGDD